MRSELEQSIAPRKRRKCRGWYGDHDLNLLIPTGAAVFCIFWRCARSKSDLPSMVPRELGTACLLALIGLHLGARRRYHRTNVVSSGCLVAGVAAKARCGAGLRFMIKICVVFNGVLQSRA